MTCSSTQIQRSNLQDTRLNDSGLLVVVDLATAAAGGLESLDDGQ